jgi:hypothetical protein
VGGDEGVGSGGTRTKHRRRRSVLLVGRILVDGAMIYVSWKYWRYNWLKMKIEIFGFEGKNIVSKSEANFYMQ